MQSDCIANGAIVGECIVNSVRIGVGGVSRVNAERELKSSTYCNKQSISKAKRKRNTSRVAMFASSRASPFIMTFACDEQ